MDQLLALPKLADPTFLAFVCKTVCEQFGRPNLQNRMSNKLNIYLTFGASVFADILLSF